MKIKPPQFLAQPQVRPIDHRNPALLSAARLYEEQFLREMVKEMRKTVNNSDLVHVGMAQKIFQGKLDDQYVKLWTKDGGIGLADLIYKQIMQEFGSQLGLQPPKPRHSGFFPVNPSQVQRVLKKSKSASLLLKVFGSPGEKQALRNPWPGDLLNSGRLDENAFFAKIAHDNGLVSEFVYPGSTEGFSAGGRLKANQTIGWVGPSIPEFSWNVMPNKSHYDMID